MFDDNHNVSPFNSLPPVVVALVCAIALVEIAFQFGSAGFAGPNGIGWRNEYTERFAFFDRYFEWMVQTGNWPLDGIKRFVTYTFIHHEAVHALMGGVLLLAIGKFVGERYSSGSVLLIFVVSSISGALGYGLLLDEPVQLVGVYPAVYGLMGAFTWHLFTSLEASGENRLKAFQLIGMLIGLQLLFKFIGGGSNDWLADLFGFISGFGMSILLAPGGIGRLLQRFRQR